MDIRPPLITGNSVEERLTQVVRYLIQLAKQLRELPDTAPERLVAPVRTEQARSSFWHLGVGKDLEVGNDLQVGNTLKVAGSINGVFMGTVRVWGVNNFCIHSNFHKWGPGVRQNFLVSGSLDNTPLLGVIRVSTGGGVQWSGTEGVTVTTEEEGVIRFTMKMLVHDYFIIQSPQEFTL